MTFSLLEHPQGAFEPGHCREHLEDVLRRILPVKAPKTVKVSYACETSWQWSETDKGEMIAGFEPSVALPASRILQLSRGQQHQREVFLATAF